MVHKSLSPVCSQEGTKERAEGGRAEKVQEAVGNGVVRQLKILPAVARFWCQGFGLWVGSGPWQLGRFWWPSCQTGEGLAHSWQAWRACRRGAVCGGVCRVFVCVCVCETGRKGDPAWTHRAGSAGQSNPVAERGSSHSIPPALDSLPGPLGRCFPGGGRPTDEHQVAQPTCRSTQCDFRMSHTYLQGIFSTPL